MGILKKVITIKSILFLLIFLSFLFTNVVNGIRHFNHSLAPDEKLYFAIAGSILEFKTEYNEGEKIFDIGEEVAPVYSVIVALMIFLFGDYRATYILQVIFNLLALWIIFKISKHFSTELIAAFFVLVLSLYYPVWAYNYHLVMEISTVYFLLLSLYFLWEYFNNNCNKYLYLSAIIYGFTVFMNNRFIFHLFVFIGIICILLIFKRNSIFKNNIKNYFIYFSLVILIISPWHIRQIFHYSELIIFTPLWTDLTHKSIKIIPESKIITDVDILSPRSSGFMTYEEIHKRMIKGNEEMSKKFTIGKYEYIKNKYNSSKWYDKYLGRAKEFWRFARFDFNYNYFGDSGIILPYNFIRNVSGIIILIPIYFFALLGLLFAIKNRERFMLIISALIFSHFVLHVLVHFIDRYRYTIFPLLFILSAYGFYMLNEKFRRKSILSSKT